MLDKATYKNSKGQTIEFGTDHIYINTNELRNYNWKYTLNSNGRIKSIKKEVIQKSLPIIILCSDQEEGLRIKNEIFEVFDYDAATGTMGKMYINGYYLPCIVSESKKTEYLYNKGYLKLELKLLSDNPFWIREFANTFNATSQEQEESGSTFLDYPYDYKFDYFSDSNSTKMIKNDHYTPCEFIMRIYGACTDPTVFINSYVYKVKTKLNIGDYLEINSKEKTIIKHLNNGNKENCFNLREKTSDIFHKIDTGTVRIRYSGSYDMDLILLQERSEPPWN